MTLVELIVAATLFAIVSMFIFAAGETFSETMQEQQGRTDTFADANTTRTRILGDANLATSTFCGDTETFSLNVGASPATLVEYYVSEGTLVRYSLPPDKESLVALTARGLTCTDLGTDGLVIAIELGDAIHPLHLHLRISDSGA